MDSKVLREVISNALKNPSRALQKAAPVTLAVALASIALIPGIKTGSSELILGASILSGIGIDFLKDFGKNRISKLNKSNDEEIQEELQTQILKAWNKPGIKGETFRREISEFLRRNNILKLALEETPTEERDGIAKSFASIANQFEEFDWVLDEIHEVLLNVQRRQVEQLATQREQLELQREQLAKTNLLLKTRRMKIAKTIQQKKQETLPQADIPCPYKGLTTFQPQDAEYFFGRESLTAQLLARLAGTSFLAVIGPSGSGKSSLVRAGLIPALWNGEIPQSDDWKVLIMRPGNLPLEELAIRTALQSGISAASLLDDLRKNSHALSLAIKQYLITQPEEAKLVLVVDQFEEIFTQCETEIERTNFIAALMDASKDDSTRCIVILTMRADFYGRCAEYPELAERLSINQVLVGAMSFDELRQAIIRPAMQVGLELEPGLVELILRDTKGQAGILPMVSHALLETWKSRNGNLLTVDSYRKFGGVQQAITSTAERLYSSFTASEQDQLREIFLRLTQLGDDSIQGDYRNFRRRVPLNELIISGGDPAKIEQLLNKLADARLIVKDVGDASGSEVEVAHEALIQNWERLHGWLNSDRDLLRLRQGVSEATREWVVKNRDTNLLIHRGGRLEDAIKLRTKMTEQEQEYLMACRNLVLHRKKLTVGGIAISTVIILFILLAWSLSSNKNAKFLSYQVSTAQSAEKTAVGETILRATAQTSAEQIAIKEAAHKLAFQAIKFAENQHSLSLLLSAQANTMSSDISSLSGLITAIETKPSNIRYLYYESPDYTYTPFEVMFSPRNLYVAAIIDAWREQTEIIVVWDLSTGSVIHKSQIDYSEKRQLLVDHIFFVGENQLAMSNYKHELAIINLSDLSVQSRTNIPDISSLSPDGTYFIGRDNYGVGIWKFPGLTQEHHFESKDFPLPVHGMSGFLIAEDNRHLVYFFTDYSESYSSTLTVVDLESNERKITHINGRLRGDITISPDGDLVACKYSNPKGSEILAVFSPGEENPLWMYKWSDVRISKFLDSDSVMLYDNNGLYIYEARTGEYLTKRTTPGINPYGIKTFISQDNHYLAFIMNGSMAIVDLKNENILSSTIQWYPEDITGVGFSQDGLSIISLSKDGSLKTTEIESGVEKHVKLPAQENPYHRGNAIQINGEIALIINQNNTLEAWDIKTAKRLTVFQRSDSYGPIVDFCLSGNTLAIAYENHDVSGNTTGAVDVWSFNEGILSTVVQTDSNEKLYPYGTWINAIAISPDEKYLAIAIYAGISVIDIQAGKYVYHTDILHSNDITRMVFSPDGSLLVSSSSDGTVIFWDTKTGERKGNTIFSNNVISIAFSPDGKILATGDYTNGEINLWDVSTREPIGIPLKMVNESVRNISFSQDGGWLVSSSSLGIIRLWDISTSRLSDLACSIANRNLSPLEWNQYVGLGSYQPVCPNLPYNP